MINAARGTPEIVKNLLIINILAFLLTFVFPAINSAGGLYYLGSPRFEPYQLITHMFLHGGFMHIFFNMFALWMFGSPLEKVWGGKRFLIYYFVCAIGAALLHQFVNFIQVQSIISELSPEQIAMVHNEGRQALMNNQNFSNEAAAQYNLIANIPVVGASGAVFGLLLGFGMLFPNTRLMLLFPPIPIKAKYFVIGYGALELFLGVMNQPGDNIAHFAHLGGMLFGFILLKIWQKRRDNFY